MFHINNLLFTTVTFIKTEPPQAGDKVAPVPIPASALLLGSGIVWLIGRVKMRRVS